AHGGISARLGDAPAHPPGGDPVRRRGSGGGLVDRLGTAEGKRGDRRLESGGPHRPTADRGRRVSVPTFPISRRPAESIRGTGRSRIPSPSEFEMRSICFKCRHGNVYGRRGEP